MMPTKSQYFFAENWPFRICLGVVLLLSVAGTLWACEPGIEMLSDWQAVRLLGWAVVLAVLLGWCSAMLIGWLVLGPVHYDRAVKNGAPFQIGIGSGYYPSHTVVVFRACMRYGKRVKYAWNWERRKRRSCVIFSLRFNC
jgi:hypothetical protein